MFWLIACNEYILRHIMIFWVQGEGLDWVDILCYIILPILVLIELKIRVRTGLNLWLLVAWQKKQIFSLLITSSIIRGVDTQRFSNTLFNTYYKFYYCRNRRRTSWCEFKCFKIFWRQTNRWTNGQSHLLRRLKTCVSISE